MRSQEHFKIGLHQFKLRLGRRESLSPRHAEVLVMMAYGMTNREIAEEFGLSIKTIEAHRACVFRRLQARNLAQAIVHAFAAGVLRMEFPAQEGAEQ